MTHTILGRQGEAAAAAYLKERCRYTLLEKNYRSRLGEIDIIARDGQTIVFIEVKTRRTALYGRPSEAVESRKQRKIALVAASYLSRKSWWNRPCRFDVMEVFVPSPGTCRINHIKNAFYA